MSGLDRMLDAEDLLDLVSRRTGVGRAVLLDTGNRHADVVAARVVTTGLLTDVAKLSTRRVGEVLGVGAGVSHRRLRAWRRRRDRAQWINAALGRTGA